jgi:NAD(P)-dependent dehydrogenase (short-subunit alcohol dehydrogenase family)
MGGAESLGPVLVTGAARRVGLAIVEGFAKAGRPVVMHASPRSMPAAATAARALWAHGARAEIVEADLADAA